MRYVYDGENRLIEARDAYPALASHTKAEYEYDYLGRRIAKIVYNWNTGTSAWNATATVHRKFIYDGWRPIMELDALDDDAVIRSYTWGLDLSGLVGSISNRSGLDGAGGIGSLLAISDPNDPNDPHGDFVIFHDATIDRTTSCQRQAGNVGHLFNLSLSDPNDPNTASDAIVAHYEYDPYGNAVTTTGDYADENPIRFSTKYWDDETGFGYWGKRYYDPRLGRWTTHDPIGMRGGRNLYAYVGNSPIHKRDPDGREMAKEPPRSSACGEFCNEHYPDESLAQACLAGCERGWAAPTWKDCANHCEAEHGSERGEAYNACYQGCMSGAPDLYTPVVCDRIYHIVGHGTKTGSVALDDGTTVDAAYMAKVVCPKLCWGARVVFWTCWTGDNTTAVENLLRACPKIKKAVACTKNLTTYDFTPFYWCSGQWKTIPNPGYRPPEDFAIAEGGSP